MTDNTQPAGADAAADARDAELTRVAQATSERVQPSDPYTEPPDSTVDDWFGQRVQHDADRVDAETQATADAPGAHIDDTDGDIPEPKEPA